MKTTRRLICFGEESERQHEQEMCFVADFLVSDSITRATYLARAYACDDHCVGEIWLKMGSGTFVAVFSNLEDRLPEWKFVGVEELPLNDRALVTTVAVFQREYPRGSFGCQPQAET